MMGGHKTGVATALCLTFAPYGPPFRRHKPVYFLEDIEDGRPQLSEAGKKAVADEVARARKAAA